MKYLSGTNFISYGFGIIRGSVDSVIIKPVKYGFKVTIKTTRQKVRVYFAYQNEAKEYVNFIHKMFTEEGDFTGEDWRMFLTYKELKYFFKKELAKDLIRKVVNAHDK